ncbi:MAG: putative 7-carboxy-7-deazaguanine synthase QueE [Eubacterium sp.]|nr:putative 7-carboxy-7-deazaguanine synthase QueE [Eubacterium sp.]
MLDVVEMFTSINGEGERAGELAFFVRFKGCNLRCSYCDTLWALEADADSTAMTPEQIIDNIKDTGVRNVTITGGEPLMQSDIYDFLEKLSREEGLRVEIETNGSIGIGPFLNIPNRPSMTMDYKLPSSKMESRMDMGNLELLEEKDTIKFVCGSIEDLDRAKYLIDWYNLTEKCSVHLSPVFGAIEPEQIVEYMKNNKMNDVRLQIQIHKVIWDPDAKGV